MVKISVSVRRILGAIASAPRLHELVINRIDMMVIIFCIDFSLVGSCNSISNGTELTVFISTFVFVSSMEKSSCLLVDIGALYCVPLFR